MQWLQRFKWVAAVLLTGMLSACQAGGHNMKASDLFEPPMVELLQSIRKGDEAHAKQLLAQGLDLNIQGKEGITPLLWLVYGTQDKDAVRLALKLGADPNYKDGYGDSAVNRVSGVRDLEWLHIVLNAGGDPNSIGRLGQPALFSPVGEGRWDNVKLLIECGADINLKDKQKRNSALYAAYINQYDFVYWFIEHGAETEGYSAPGADLAWVLHDSQSIMSPDSPQYPWLLKVKEQLIQRGVTFPPLSPTEVRERRAKGEKL